MLKKILITLLTIVLLGAGVFAFFKFVPTKVAIPADLVQKMNIPLYLPTFLPGSYELDRDSFAIEEGRILIFSATDSERNRLFFSQQEISEGFDFERFYLTQLIEPVKIENTPFETIYAKSLYSNTWILSMKTDSTWIMMSTVAPVGEVLAQKIAQEMKRY